MLLSAGAIVVIMTAAMGFARSITELASMVKAMTENGDVMIVPVLKCVGIGAITRISSELCRDAAQSSAAAVTLVPAWCVQTDTGLYYVNCSSGAVTHG